jgi:hypothetical protein
MTPAIWAAIIIAVFGANGAGTAWLLGRAQRRSKDAENKITESGVAMGGFRDLVVSLQAERSAKDARIAALEARVAELESGKGRQ